MTKLKTKARAEQNAESTNEIDLGNDKHYSLINQFYNLIHLLNCLMKISLKTSLLIFKLGLELSINTGIQILKS